MGNFSASRESEEQRHGGIAGHDWRITRLTCHIRLGGNKNESKVHLHHELVG